MGFGVAGVDGCAAESLEPSGVFPGGGGEFGFGEVAVGGEGEDAAEVPEAGEGGDEFDEVFAAEGVEGLEVAGGVGVVGAGDVGVELEAEGVLEVELEVVDFEGGEETDAAFEGFEAGDAPAADVEVVAAEGPCGGVGDGEAGEGVGGGLLADLAEGLEGVEVAGGVGGGDVDVAGGDAELVGFGGGGGGFEQDVGGGLLGCDVVEGGEEFVEGFGDARVGGGWGADGGGGGEGEGAAFEAEGLGRGEEVQHGGVSWLQKVAGADFSTVWKSFCGFFHGMEKSFPRYGKVLGFWGAGGVIFPRCGKKFPRCGKGGMGRRVHAGGGRWTSSWG